VKDAPQSQSRSLERIAAVHHPKLTVSVAQSVATGRTTATFKNSLLLPLLSKTGWCLTEADDLHGGSLFSVSIYIIL
jgi:hypothetical protein